MHKWGGEEKSFEDYKGCSFQVSSFCCLFFFCFVFMSNNQEGRSTPEIPVKGYSRRNSTSRSIICSRGNTTSSWKWEGVALWRRTATFILWQPLSSTKGTTRDGEPPPVLSSPHLLPDVSWRKVHHHHSIVISSSPYIVTTTIILTSTRRRKKNLVNLILISLAVKVMAH